jgi:hypothetical protein
MLAIASDVSAGGWMTLALPVGLLIVVIAWSFRYRERVR